MFFNKKEIKYEIVEANGAFALMKIQGNKKKYPLNLSTVPAIFWITKDDELFFSQNVWNKDKELIEGFKKRLES